MAVRVDRSAVEIDKNLFVTLEGDEVQIQLKDEDTDSAFYTVHLSPSAQKKLIKILTEKKPKNRKEK